MGAAKTLARAKRREIRLQIITNCFPIQTSHQKLDYFRGFSVFEYSPQPTKYLFLRRSRFGHHSSRASPLRPTRSQATLTEPLVRAIVRESLSERSRPRTTLRSAPKAIENKPRQRSAPGLRAVPELRSFAYYASHIAIDTPSYRYP